MRQKCVHVHVFTDVTEHLERQWDLRGWHCIEMTMEAEVTKVGKPNGGLGDCLNRAFEGSK